MLRREGALLKVIVSGQAGAPPSCTSTHSTSSFSLDCTALSSRRTYASDLPLFPFAADRDRRGGALFRCDLLADRRCVALSTAINSLLLGAASGPWPCVAADRRSAFDLALGARIFDIHGSLVDPTIEAEHFQCVLCLLDLRARGSSEKWDKIRFRTSIGKNEGRPPAKPRLEPWKMSKRRHRYR